MIYKFGSHTMREWSDGYIFVDADNLKSAKAKVIREAKKHPYLSKAVDAIKQDLQNEPEVQGVFFISGSA